MVFPNASTYFRRLGKSVIEALANLGKIYPMKLTVFYAVVGSKHSTIVVGSESPFS